MNTKTIAAVGLVAVVCVAALGAYFSIENAIILKILILGEEFIAWVHA